MSEGPRPRPGASQRGPQPDPARRPAPGVADLRGRLLSGHGSPEGAVYAGKGAMYQDVDPAGGGAIHRKTTPAGNTGWQELGGGGGRLGFKALNSTAQIVPENTSTFLTGFQNVVLDDAGGLDTAATAFGMDAVVYHATVPGWYVLHSEVFWNLSSESARDWAALEIWETSTTAMVASKAGQFYGYPAGSDAAGRPLLDVTTLAYSDGSAVWGNIFRVGNPSLAVTPNTGGQEVYGESFWGFLIG